MRAAPVTHRAGIANGWTFWGFAKGVTMVSSTASLSDTWRVGVLFSRTGLTAVTETEHFLGTALAIQEINQALRYHLGGWPFC